PHTTLGRLPENQNLERGGSQRRAADLSKADFPLQLGRPLGKRRSKGRKKEAKCCWSNAVSKMDANLAKFRL
ncbi:hypothetical protein EBZ37_10480, partial [bacterium]|nr:hypothetical protein [bacterium]